MSSVTVHVSRIFVFELDFLDLLEGNHDLFGSGAFLNLEVEIVGGNAADALSSVLAALRAA